MFAMKYNTYSKVVSYKSFTNATWTRLLKSPSESMLMWTRQESRSATFSLTTIPKTGIA
jgi:hypothetical protein